MRTESPRRWYVILGGVAGWVSCTWVALFLDGALQANNGTDEILWGVAVDLFRTAATLFGALAIGGGLLGAWQRRQWRLRTQWVASDLLDRAMSEVAHLAAAARAVSDAMGRKSTWEDAAFYQVFTYPFTEVKARALAGEADSVVMEHAEKLKIVDLPTDQLDRLIREHHLMREAADQLWSAVTELSQYVDDWQSSEILRATSELHSHVRMTVDPTPGTEIPGWGRVAFTVTSLGTAFKATVSVAKALDGAFTAVRRRAKGELKDRMDVIIKRGMENDVALREDEQENANFRARFAAFDDPSPSSE